MVDKIKIQIKTVYGEDKAYPVDTAGQLFASISQTKTLPRWVLCKVLEMGLAIEVVDRFGNVSATFKAGNHRPVGLPATIR